MPTIIPQKFQPHRVNLSTKVISSKGEELPVYAYWYKQDCKYIVKLQLENGNEIGAMRLYSNHEAAKIEIVLSPNQDYLVIDDMQNYSQHIPPASPPSIFEKPVTYKHVGKALDEFAFKFSIEQGFEGKIELKAVGNSHLFFYLNGFRNALYDRDNYYQKLMQDIYDSKGKHSNADLGSCFLRLPSDQIAQKAKDLGIYLEVDADAYRSWDSWGSRNAVKAAEHINKVKFFEEIIEAALRDHRVLVGEPETVHEPQETAHPPQP